MADLNLDPADLEDYALESGASVHAPNGSVFNAANRKGVYRLPKRVESPVPQAPVESGSDKLVSILTEMVAKMQPAPAPIVHVAAPDVIHAPSQRVLDWTFTFERNSDGTIKSIRAKAT